MEGAEAAGLECSRTVGKGHREGPTLFLNPPPNPLPLLPMPSSPATQLRLLCCIEIQGSGW